MECNGFGKATALRFRDAGLERRGDDDEHRGVVGAPSENLLVLPLDIRDDESIRRPTRAIELRPRRLRRQQCRHRTVLGVRGNADRDRGEPFETNVFGAMRVMQAIFPHFRDNGGGRIVNASSSSAIVPEPLLSVYSASKWAAVDGFTELSATSWRPRTSW